jgi:mycofactocin precursor
MSDRPTTAAGPARPATAEEPGPVVVEDVLVEEVSIDGMCGVY